MAYKWAIAILGCICLGLSIACVCVQISRHSMAVSIEELKAENVRLNLERVDALGEVEFLRSAIRRLDATVKEANAAIDKAEEAHHARKKEIDVAPAEWLSCPLPASVCDAFGGYAMPAATADAGGADAAMRAAEN